MRVGPFWGGALVLVTALAGCSSMKAAILGNGEGDVDTSTAEPESHARLAEEKSKSDSSEQAAADAKPPATPEAVVPPTSSTAAPSATQKVSTTVTPSVEGIPIKPLSKKDLEQDAQRDFTRATELLQNGQESQALVSFTDFLRRYPEHKLVGDAQFSIGEIFYRQRKYPQALNEFQKVKDLLKGGSQRTPDAFVRIGECHLKLGNVDRARIEWNAVRRRYLGTAAAMQADVLLKGLPR